MRQHHHSVVQQGEHTNVRPERSPVSIRIHLSARPSREPSPPPGPSVSLDGRPGRRRARPGAGPRPRRPARGGARLPGRLSDLQPASASPLDGARAKLVFVQHAGASTFVLVVSGVGATGVGNTYGAHLHTGACVAGNGAAAGPHYNQSTLEGVVPWSSATRPRSGSTSPSATAAGSPSPRCRSCRRPATGRSFSMPNTPTTTGPLAHVSPACR